MSYDFADKNSNNGDNNYNKSKMNSLHILLWNNPSISNDSHDFTPCKWYYYCFTSIISSVFLDVVFGEKFTVFMSFQILEIECGLLITWTQIKWTIGSINGQMQMPIGQLVVSPFLCHVQCDKIINFWSALWKNETKLILIESACWTNQMNLRMAAFSIKITTRTRNCGGTYRIQLFEVWRECNALKSVLRLEFRRQSSSKNDG